ncbi:MAG TPA: hypothetical protein VMP68_22975 [Candidatus Eisenbacteria bacterium]|nr:hypothetical protein [Candidatus Eisenbacteria bacterium]
MKLQPLMPAILLLASALFSGRNGHVTVAKVWDDLCGCGPDLCLNDPRYAPKVAKKKADLKHLGFPDDLIALQDRDGKCVMAIEQAPDSLWIRLVADNGNDSNSIESNQQDEDLAEKQILRRGNHSLLQVQRQKNVCLPRRAEGGRPAGLG